MSPKIKLGYVIGLKSAMIITNIDTERYSIRTNYVIFNIMTSTSQSLSFVNAHGIKCDESVVLF